MRHRRQAPLNPLLQFVVHIEEIQSGAMHQETGVHWPLREMALLDRQRLRPKRHDVIMRRAETLPVLIV